jgi:hypothetical protein
MKPKKDLPIKEVLKLRSLAVKLSDMTAVFIMALLMFLFAMLLIIVTVGKFADEGVNFENVVTAIAVGLLIIVMPIYAVKTSRKMRIRRKKFESALKLCDLEKNQYYFIIAEEGYEDKVVETIEESLPSVFAPNVKIVTLPSLYFNHNYALLQIKSVVGILQITTQNRK